MPRYFFNIHDGETSLDEEGTDLSDPRAASVAAVAMSGELIRDHAARFWPGHLWKLDVTDERGAVVFTLNLAAHGASGIGGEA